VPALFGGTDWAQPKNQWRNGIPIDLICKLSFRTNGARLSGGVIRGKDTGWPLAQERVLSLGGEAVIKRVYSALRSLDIRVVKGVTGSRLIFNLNEPTGGSLMVACLAGWSLWER